MNSQKLSFVALAALASGCSLFAQPAAPIASTAANTQDEPSVTQTTSANSSTATKATGDKQLTEGRVNASEAANAPFPSIADVTKEFGAPTESGNATHQTWYFDKRATNPSFTSCTELHALKAPSGRTELYASSFTSDKCKPVTNTKARAVEALKNAGGSAPGTFGAEPISLADSVTGLGKPYEQVSPALEKSLGKATSLDNLEYAAWRYANSEGACRMYVLTKPAGSTVTYARFSVPCK